MAHRITENTIWSANIRFVYDHGYVYHAGKFIILNWEHNSWHKINYVRPKLIKMCFEMIDDKSYSQQVPPFQYIRYPMSALCKCFVLSQYNVTWITFNLWHAELVCGSIKILAYFVLTFIGISPVVEFLPWGKQWHSYLTGSISWLLMTWRRKEPRYLQLWYWPSSPEIYQPQHQRGYETLMKRVQDDWHLHERGD